MQAPYAAYPPLDEDLFTMVLRSSITTAFNYTFIATPLTALDYKIIGKDAHMIETIQLHEGFREGLWYSLNRVGTIILCAANGVPAPPTDGTVVIERGIS